MNKLSKNRKGMAANIIGAVVVLLLIFSIISSAIGYFSFTNAYKKEYSRSTQNIANTAVTFVNADNIDGYLSEGGTSEEYKHTLAYLDKYCINMKVSLVYVIKVDTSDYGRFTSVFNSVGEDVPYTPWEIGYQQDTTNEEYAEIYKEIYSKEREYATVFRTKNLGKGIPAHITALVPVKDSKGDVVSIMCIQRPMTEYKGTMSKYLVRIGLATLLLAIVVAVSYAFFIRKQFVKPVKRVADEATRFAAENSKGNMLGEISKIREIASLAASIDTMEDEMLRYIDNLTAVTSEKERIGAELSIASTIQENSIPNIFPAFPSRNEFDIFASMVPAKEVGGDFYNFFLVDDDHLAMVMADVSGKGIPAALFMMVTNILISDRTHMGGTPADILTFVNNNICEHNPADMFVTVWLGILEITTGKITAANAGHDDPAVFRNNEDFELVKNKRSLVVGAMPEIKYKNFEIQLNKGDKLFLYTDGLPEATDGNNRMFTAEGMLEALNQHSSESPEAILSSVKKCVDEFVGDAPQFDDLTMMCLEYKGKDNGNTLTVEATNDNLHQVMAFVDEFLEENGASMKAQMQFDLAVEEIFVNIANYAYGDGSGKAEISVNNENGEVSVSFKDSGTPYNPLEKEDPDITLSAEEREIGGLGIFLTKKNMDSVSYEYKDGYNILIMKKLLK